MKKKAMITLGLLFSITSSFAGSPENVTCVDTTTGNSYRFGISENWMEFKLKGQDNYQSCLTHADHIENQVLNPKDYKTLNFISIAEKSSKSENGGAEMLKFECKDTVSGETSVAGAFSIYVDYSPFVSVLTMTGKLPFSEAAFGYSAILGPELSSSKIDNDSDPAVVCEGIAAKNLKYPNLYQLKK